MKRDDVVHELIGVFIRRNVDPVTATEALATVLVSNIAAMAERENVDPMEGLDALFCGMREQMKFAAKRGGPVQ